MGRYLILGNGFDIAHDLPTSYKDFLFICANVLDVEFEIEYDSDKELLMKNILALFKQTYDSSLNEIISNNVWIKYFLSIYNSTGEKWVDFEKEIKKVCEACYLLKENEYLDSTYEMFESLDYEEGYNIIKMKADLADLIEVFNKYLLILPYDYLVKFYKEIIDFAPTDVISFNYTNTYNKMYNKNLNIDYVHGKISNTVNTMVLGFDSMKDDIADVKFGEFLKYFQMVEKDIELKSYINLQRIEPQYSGFNQAMFFGHSMDKTDSDIIKKVIDSVGLVKVVYYSIDHKKQMIKNLIEIFGRNTFIDLTLSNHKKIYFEKQTDAMKYNKFEVDEIKNILNNIQTIDFGNCTGDDLKSIINNGKIQLGSIILYSLKQELECRNRVFYPNVSPVENFDELQAILNDAYNKISN